MSGSCWRIPVGVPPWAELGARGIEWETLEAEREMGFWRGETEECDQPTFSEMENEGSWF